jgi:hypothetical protein
MRTSRQKGMPHIEDPSPIEPEPSPTAENTERVLTGCTFANHARSAGNVRHRRLRSGERGIDTEGYSGLPRGTEHVEDRTR